MHADYLHNHKEFPELLNILAEELGISAGLIEKDYWIMHVLHCLKSQGFHFELKGGTSLSKGYKIIDRFSEDIDIHIKPPKEFGINRNSKNTNAKNVQARREFYDWLSKNIQINGIISIERDTNFDDTIYYRSGGIRLHYNSKAEKIIGLKDGILLEAGFDTVAPNMNLSISSWAYDKAAATFVDVIDNKAIEITCYHPGYTFVEKLQTIATKFRKERSEKQGQQNFMRHYYDLYCLLNNDVVQKFIGTAEYYSHKDARFPKADLEVPVAKNEAFLLSSEDLRANFAKRYKQTSALYYNGQPPFDDILHRISEHLNKL